MTDNIWDHEPTGAPEDGDYGPRIELTVGAVVNKKAVNGVPNPEYLGKTLLLEGVTVAEFESTNDDGVKVTKEAIDAAKITVVETGEVFERQRLFPTGIVRKLAPMIKAAGGHVDTFPAVVGAYESKKAQFKGRKFVELVRPTDEQKAAALKLAGGSTPAAPVEAPF